MPSPWPRAPVSSRPPATRRPVPHRADCRSALSRGVPPQGIPHGGADIRETPPAAIAETAANHDANVARLASSVAVLPFANLSSDPENEFFGEGISEEVLNQTRLLSEQGREEDALKVRESVVQGPNPSPMAARGRAMRCSVISPRRSTGWSVRRVISRTGNAAATTASSFPSGAATRNSRSSCSNGA